MQIKYRNDTGGRFSIPVRGPSEHLEGAIGSWLHLEHGDTFIADADEDGVPVNPSLRVAYLTKDGGINPVSTSAPAKPKRQPKRQMGKLGS